MGGVQTDAYGLGHIAGEERDAVDGAGVLGMVGEHEDRALHAPP
jgi:hypothetical protein